MPGLTTRASRSLLAQPFLWFSGVFSGYTWQKLELPDSEFEVFKTEQEKLFVLISITLCADGVATHASLDQIICFNMWMV